MNKLIEKLKDKTYVRAFSLMTPEEQQCLEKVGPQNCLILCQSGINPQVIIWDNNNMADFSGYRTYAIKPDYQPEPEYVDLEIVKGHDKEKDDWLGVHTDYKTKNDFLPHTFTHLHCLPSLPNFECFFYEDIECGVVELNTNWVSRERDDSTKVYARFRKRE